MCPVVLSIAIHFSMVQPTLTSLGFSVFRIDWPAWWQSLLLLLAVFHCCVPFIGCQLGLKYCYRSICWPAKPCMKNSLLIFTPCLLHHFHPIHCHHITIIVCQSLGSRPTQVQELFTLVPHLFGTTSRCLSVQPFQLLPLRNFWGHISFSWPFPHRYRHAQCPVDVTELSHRFCCWTLIPLSYHWAWLHRGYRRYRNLIEWLIGRRLKVKLSWYHIAQNGRVGTLLDRYRKPFDNPLAQWPDDPQCHNDIFDDYNILSNWNMGGWTIYWCSGLYLTFQYIMALWQMWSMAFRLCS